MVIYRRTRKRDTWHWCTNCPEWPTKDYFEIKKSYRPTNGDICAECLKLDKTDQCKKKHRYDPEPPPSLNKIFPSYACSA